jgi:type IV secretion system protein VirB3
MDAENLDEKDDFPLFQGMTRIPKVFGVPIEPLMLLVLVTYCVQAVLGLMWTLLGLPFYLLMLLIVRKDDRAFHILWLVFLTRVINGNKRFWNGSSYTPNPYSKRQARLWRRR